MKDKGKMLSLTVVEVVLLENYKLLIWFDNQEKRIFDVRPYIKGSWYGKLT